MLPHCVCTEAIITLVKHCLKLGLLPMHKERNLKFCMLSGESSEDHPCGGGYHISSGQLSTFQFRKTPFGDFYFKRILSRQWRVFPSSLCLSCSVHIPGGRWCVAGGSE